MRKTNRALLADLGFAIAIPQGWRRITHSMWGPTFPAMHYNISRDDGRQADYELTCSRQAAIRQSSGTAAETLESELSQAYGKFAYAETKIGGQQAVRLDCTDAFGAPEYMRHYCLVHHGHLMKLRVLFLLPQTATGRGAPYTKRIQPYLRRMRRRMRQDSRWRPTAIECRDVAVLGRQEEHL